MRLETDGLGPDEMGMSSALITIDRNNDAIATIINIANGKLHPDSPPTRKAGSILPPIYDLQFLDAQKGEEKRMSSEYES